MKNLLFPLLFVGFASCRHEPDPSPPIVLVPLDTLPRNRVEVEQNGVKFNRPALAVWNTKAEYVYWGFTTGKIYNPSNPEENLALYAIAFAPGLFKIHQISWPTNPAEGGFWLTEQDTAYEIYDIDSTANNYVLVEKVDTANLEVIGKFEAVFLVRQPKRESFTPDTVTFKNGRFRLNIRI